MIYQSIIYNVFYKRGWIEKWGTGTTRMVEYCKSNTTPEPEFSEEFYGFSVVFPFKDVMHTTPVTTPFHSTVQNQLSQRQKEIVSILETGGTMSLKEIFNKLDNPPAEKTFREDMTTLKRLKIINSSGLSRATKWQLIK